MKMSCSYSMHNNANRFSTLILSFHRQTFYHSNMMLKGKLNLWAFNGRHIRSTKEELVLSSQSDYNFNAIVNGNLSLAMEIRRISH